MVLGRRAPALLPARMATANILSESGAIDNYTLVSLSEERVSEAGVNSAAGSFGLSFELAFAGAIMLATLAFPSPTWPRTAPSWRRPTRNGSPWLSRRMPR
jgi:hypothetical protein